MELTFQVHVSCIDSFNVFVIIKDDKNVLVLLSLSCLWQTDSKVIPTSVHLLVLLPLCNPLFFQYGIDL